MTAREKIIVALARRHRGHLDDEAQRPIDYIVGELRHGDRTPADQTFLANTAVTRMRQSGVLSHHELSTVGFGAELA